MKLFRYILCTTAPYRKTIIAMLFCVFLIAVDANLRPYIIKLIIDQSSNFDSRTFLFLSLVFISSQVLMVLSNTAFDWLGTKFHTSYRASTTHKFFDKISNYDYKFFQETQSGAITARITDAFNTIPVIIFVAIKVFINFTLFTSIALIILSKISYFFVIINITWIFLFIALIAVFYNKYQPLNQEFAKIRPKIYGFLADYFFNILSVWFFNKKSSESKNLHKLTDEFISKGVYCGKFLRNYYILHGLIVTIYMSILLSLLNYLSIHNNISPGDFALVFIINYKIVDLLFEISGLSREFITNCGVAENAITLLDHDIRKDTNTKIIKLSNAPDIEIKNLNFSYHQNKIFNELSVKINHGEKVGIVGASGSGKSSFINLILRLYKLDSGTITIDSQDISKVPLESLYSNIALIPQESALFHRSIFDNISFGNPIATKKDVIEVAKKAKAHEFIQSLNNGYDTLVGERGIKLSGGQKQRIAFARAILKDAPIFILDEATSQLDSITENNIRDNMHEILKNKTALVVAHRLSTLEQMDRILVFDNGKIIEDGTKEELLKKDGMFRKLWNAQKDGMIII